MLFLLLLLPLSTHCHCPIFYSPKANKHPSLCYCHCRATSLKACLGTSLGKEEIPVSILENISPLFGFHSLLSLSSALTRYRPALVSHISLLLPALPKARTYRTACLQVVLPCAVRDIRSTNPARGAENVSRRSRESYIHIVTDPDAGFAHPPHLTDVHNRHR